MGIKECTRCKEIKPIGEFGVDKKAKDGLSYWCKGCRRQYREDNAEHIKQYNDGNIEYRKQYRKDNIEHRKQYRKQYRKNNIEKIRAEMRRRLLIPKNKLSASISTGIWKSLKGAKNGNHWEELVGYTIEELMGYLGSLFKDGMNWENQGKWHIDHILPISIWEFSSYDDREFKQCWALCNLQPLWARENISKGNKIFNKGVAI